MEEYLAEYIRTELIMMKVSIALLIVTMIIYIILEIWRWYH